MTAGPRKCWEPPGVVRELVKYKRERWQRILRVVDSRPYLRYVAVLDSKTSEEHRRRNGTVLRWDHPWWCEVRRLRCRCGVIQLSEWDLERFGYEISMEPPD
ncbi:MAG: phage minor head protein [Rhodobacteraceae bacterium]|nr:phage minor head protein [Paracoccaceae bacterium]